nr:unnamed protein product [Callosobruchus chinensis]CAH7719733.1 unnamed protein product [Callosobruchus chinensis]
MNGCQLFWVHLVPCTRVGFSSSISISRLNTPSSRPR